MIENKKELLTEIVVILIAIVFMAFILSLDIKWVLPTINIELKNFFLMLLYTFIMFAVFVGSQKLVAYALDCKTTTKLLSFRRYWFRPQDVLPFEFPVWFLLPLLFALIPLKGFEWPAILNFDVEPKTTRVKRRWHDITESDVGKIAIAGPLALMVLGIIARFFGTNDFTFYCLLFAFIALIPIGLGFKLLNSSRILWFFSIIFALAMLLLTQVQNTFAVVLTALIFAILATLAYYILYEK